MTQQPDIDAATQFLAASARVLDRRRFERLFGGSAGPVRDAVAAYRNADGGYGHALEPDGRCPASQPAAIERALRILDEADAWDEELVTGACDWLQANAPAAGGAVFVEPSVLGWPHAPWWVPEDGRPPSLVSTGQIAGTLHARGVAHPWLDKATELVWSLIDELAEPGPYDLYGVLRFLDYVPDRGRAKRALDLVAPMLLDVVAHPQASGETHSVLGFAPLPTSLARGLFDEAVIRADLDHLAAAQQDDGGWTFSWLAWSPVAERDWRGSITVDALRILRDNGRSS